MEATKVQSPSTAPASPVSKKKRKNNRSIEVQTSWPSVDVPEVVRTRRSALDFSQIQGQNSISQPDFFSILLSCVPALNPVYWNQLGPWGAKSSFVIYASYVDDLTPGTYVLVRDSSELKSLKAMIKSDDASWERVDSAPEGLGSFQSLCLNTLRVSYPLSCCRPFLGEEGRISRRDSQV